MIDKKIILECCGRPEGECVCPTEPDKQEVTAEALRKKTYHPEQDELLTKLDVTELINTIKDPWQLVRATEQNILAKAKPIIEKQVIREQIDFLVDEATKVWAIRIEEAKKQRDKEWEESGNKWIEAICNAKREEREKIQALYENMGCVPEEDNCWYRFWQALKGGQ